jgi:hypothetical protein
MNTKIKVVLALATLVIIVMASKPEAASTVSSSGPTAAQMQDANVQLRRIADALEIIAGTGGRQWKAPK